MSEPVSFEEYLRDNDTLTYTNVGTSMLPLLREGRDLFIVRRKGSERCKKGDVVLYWHPPDRYVLHRIIDVTEECYILMGDNTVSKEYGIKDSDIIGVMTGYVRNGICHSTGEYSYRLYSFLIMNTVRLRVFCKKMVIRLKGHIKRLKHENK